MRVWTKIRKLQEPQNLAPATISSLKELCVLQPVTILSHQLFINFQEVSCASTPEYRFDQFILLCEECQRRKRVIEAKLKEIFEKIRATSNLDEQLSAEQKHYVMSLISRYRHIQEEQNTLIEREKVRLQMMKSELGRKEESVQKIRNRLKYVIALNKDHENIITHIQQERKRFSMTSNSTIANDLRLR